MGLGFDYFYSLTPRQFNNIQVGYLKKERYRREEALLHTKILSWFIYSGIPKKKGARNKSFESFSREFFEARAEVRNTENPETQEERREWARNFFRKVDKKKQANGKPQSN